MIHYSASLLCLLLWHLILFPDGSFVVYFLCIFLFMYIDIFSIAKCFKEHILLQAMDNKGVFSFSSDSNEYYKDQVSWILHFLALG